MRSLFVLPGAHRIPRGAEVAFENIAHHLAAGGDEVTLVGGGPPTTGRAYAYVQLAHRGRESYEGFPALPPFREPTDWEQIGFGARLARLDLSTYDVTVTCSYPVVNWVLRARAGRNHRPRHVYVTENGDWPAHRTNSEYRYFDCDGLVCTNPEYYEAHRARFRSALIPNGVDTSRFTPGPAKNPLAAISDASTVVLMVSALIPTKRVDAAVRAVAALPEAHLLVAGDGPERQTVDALAADLLPGRYTRTTVTPSQMPDLYRAADVFLHMSLDEAFGNVYLEAACCGTPVVAVDNPSARWILGDDRGLTPPGDHEAVVNALRDAIAAGKDEAVLERSAACRQRFDWSTVAESYRTFLQEVVTAPASPWRTRNS